MNRNRRVPIIALLIVTLLLAGFTRHMAWSKRNAGQSLGTGGSQAANTGRLTRMNSFALALLLGGLRGPLVMVLWTSSESQKSEKNLQDFDTKVEWIRLLQPEFDSVHIFQIWNKAYNVSVQMASKANKYLTIIDAIDYAKRVDRERPDNINILYQIGSVYGDKLGDSAEKLYYTKRVRDESLPHDDAKSLAARERGARSISLDPILDESGRVRSDYLQPTRTLLTDPNNPQDVYDGGELPFLTRFEPYPYGVGPIGIGYNYRKRAQLLQRLGGQKHSQLSEVVIDSRPALDLKKWGEAEWDHGRRCEILALGREVPLEVLDMETITAAISPRDVRLSEDSRKLFHEAIASYELAERVWQAADAEYIEHLRHFKNQLKLYESHREEVQAQRALINGDRDYLRAILAEGAERDALLKSARGHYRSAVARYMLTMFRFYVPEEIARKVLPPGVTRDTVAASLEKNTDDITPEQIAPILGNGIQQMQADGWPASQEIGEYFTFVERAEARLQNLPE